MHKSQLGWMQRFSESGFMKNLCLLFQDILSPETFLKKLLDNAPSHTNESELKKMKYKSSVFTCKCNIINSASGPLHYRVLQAEICGSYIEENGENVVVMV
jgi:hypothetical protein